MTLACGVVVGDRVVMGGDSALSADGGDQTVGQPKVFKHAEMLFGCSGELHIVQLLKHLFEVPALGKDQDPEAYIVRDFARQFRALLAEESESLISTMDDDTELWNLLIGFRGRLFRLCSHFTVRESATGYDAIGSGTPFALGSFASTENLSAHERVELALRAAERHVTTVRGPFAILEL